MSQFSELPLFHGLPKADLPTDEPLILASGSPRRAQLLQAAGYDFTVQVAGEEAECGVCSRETAPEMVARYAYRKAADIVSRNRSRLGARGRHGCLVSGPNPRQTP